MNYRIWLKLPAALGLLMLLLPPCNLLRAVLTGAFPVSSALLVIAVLLLAMLCGYLIAAAMENRSVLAGRVLVLAGALLFGAGACLFGVLTGVFAAVALPVGAVVRHRGYAELLCEPVFYAFLIESVLSAGLLWVFYLLGWTQAYDISALLLVFLIALGCYGIVRNQANIDCMMERRRHRLEDLPPKIRAYNLLLTCGSFVLVLLLFLLRGPILAGLRALGEGLRQGVLAFLRFLLWLSSLMQSESAGEAPAQGEMDFGTVPPEHSGAFDFLIKLFLVAAAVFLVYHYRRELLTFLRDKWDRLCALLHRLLFERASHGPDHSAPDSPYYRDTVEELARTRTPVGPGGASLRAWRRSVRQFRKLPDDAEKVRFGYRLALEWLRFHGGVAASDTVQEITDKTRPLVPGEDYPRAAWCYERVRYGGDEPAEGEIAFLERTLEEMSRKKKNS